MQPVHILLPGGAAAAMHWFTMLGSCESIVDRGNQHYHFRNVEAKGFIARMDANLVNRIRDVNRQRVVFRLKIEGAARAIVLCFLRESCSVVLFPPDPDVG